MTPLIQTPEDMAKLRAIAETWVGTPYAPDGAVKGAGASCHLVPAEILREFGMALPPIPRRTGMTKREIGPTMAAWLDSHPAIFSRVDSPHPGDLILTEIPFGHLALLLDRGEIVHAWQREGTHVAAYEPAKLTDRVRGYWRPLSTT